MDQNTQETLKKVAELVTPAVTEATIAKIKEDITLKKAIHADGASAEMEEDKKKAAGLFQKLARGEMKSLTVGGSTSGAEMVPTYVASEIERVAQKNGLVRQFARKWPMSGVKENVPTASSVTAYRVNEGVKVTSSQPVTGAVSLSAKTVGVIIPVSKKLLLGATPALIDRLNELGGEAIAKLEDQWGLLGLGSNEGVFQTTGVPGVVLGSGDTTYAKVEAEDLLDCIDKIDPNALDEKVRFVMHLSVFNALRKQRAAVSTDKQGFLFQGYGDKAPATMWDLPYSLSSVMPKTADESQASKKFIALANFGHIYYGNLGSYTFEISDQATITDTDGNTLINLFEQNMVALKISGEVDIQVASPTLAHSYIQTAAS